MNCALCNLPVPDDHDEMIDAGWIPYYYVGRQEKPGPVCPDCCEKRLRLGQDSEWEIVPRGGAHRYN